VRVVLFDAVHVMSQNVLYFQKIACFHAAGINVFFFFFSPEESRVLLVSDLHVTQNRSTKLDVDVIITYVIRTNKMHTFFINDLIQLYFLQHVSINQEFIFRKFRTCSFMVSSTSCHRSGSLYGDMNKYHTTACTSLPEDDHLDVRNMLKTI